MREIEHQMRGKAGAGGRSGRFMGLQHRHHDTVELIYIISYETQHDVLSTPIFFLNAFCVVDMERRYIGGERERTAGGLLGALGVWTPGPGRSESPTLRYRVVCLRLKTNIHTTERVCFLNAYLFVSVYVGKKSLGLRQKMRCTRSLCRYNCNNDRCAVLLREGFLSMFYTFLFPGEILRTYK